MKHRKSPSSRKSRKEYRPYRILVPSTFLVDGQFNEEGRRNAIVRAKRITLESDSWKPMRVHCRDALVYLETIEYAQGELESYTREAPGLTYEEEMTVKRGMQAR